jgi:hypothetical protein
MGNLAQKIRGAGNSLASAIEPKPAVEVRRTSGGRGPGAADEEEGRAGYTEE